MSSLTIVTVCALGYALVFGYVVCRTLVFTHTERANALRSIHSRLLREAAGQASDFQ